MRGNHISHGQVTDPPPRRRRGLLSTKPARLRGLVLASVTGWLALTGVSPSAAGLVYRFGNGGIFEGDGGGANAAFPLADDDSGLPATLTTQRVSQADGTLGGTLNENTDSLGINNLGGSDARFNGQESWQFAWDVDTALEQIEFEALKAGSRFLLQSSAWVGLSMASSRPSLAFDPSEGTLFFSNDGADAFDLTALLSGDPLRVAAGTPYTLGFDDGGSGDNAGIDRFRFAALAPLPLFPPPAPPTPTPPVPTPPSSPPAAAVPEPASGCALLGLAGLLAVGRRLGRPSALPPRPLA